MDIKISEAWLRRMADAEDRVGGIFIAPRIVTEDDGEVEPPLPPVFASACCDEEHIPLMGADMEDVD